ncbi:hypothetical protein, partial [Megasphaera sp.]|uniref:hypothetical protein n=1 Tax=Megasphaera sp. TaxID=2023260 RepID=UPI001D307511
LAGSIKNCHRKPVAETKSIYVFSSVYLTGSSSLFIDPWLFYWLYSIRMLFFKKMEDSVLFSVCLSCRKMLLSGISLIGWDMIELRYNHGG